MSILNGIVNEFDIALKTLSDKKTGTEREYPPRPIQKNVEELTKKEKEALKSKRTPKDYTMADLPLKCGAVIKSP